MGVATERHLAGIAAVRATTELLQRNRAMHPTAGMYEAADFQWWWRSPRRTDEYPQLFWFDDVGPVAAVIATAWGDATALDPLLLPDADDDRAESVVGRGLEHAAANGIEHVELEAVPDGPVERALLRNGFTPGDGGYVEGWIDADDVPVVSPIADGYSLQRRTDRTDRPHHYIRRSGADVEARLLQTSLYSPDRDLLVEDDEGDEGDAVASGLCWFDPVTRTGLVEPMRTEDDHQRKGLARHLLTSGLALLVGAGAERVKICWSPDNQPAANLYLDVGFVPDRRTRMFAGPTGGVPG